MFVEVSLQRQAAAHTSKFMTPNEQLCRRNTSHVTKMVMVRGKRVFQISDKKDLCYNQSMCLRILEDHYQNDLYNDVLKEKLRAVFVAFSC